MVKKELFEFDYSLNAGDKFYLNDIIPEETYDEMFRGRNISFLNKGQCGNGGTTGFIRYALQNNRGCLILVPNRSIVISKEEEYKNSNDVCCVYGGSPSFRRDDMVVIATYDQFPKLLKALYSGGFSHPENVWDCEFWSGRTIIIDEYHKLIDDNGYRDICYKITELIKNTSNAVVLMSATPHYGYIEFLRDIVKDKDVVSYDIRYEDETRLIRVYDVQEKDLRSILKKVKDSPKNKQTCVFYNNVKGISKIIDHIGDDECEVLCSETNKEELGVYYSSSFNENKRVHFMTSAYFTGHDISTSIKQCIIIGSRETENMCLGERDIKQMIGRFRKGVEGIHILYLNKKIQTDAYQKIRNTYDKNRQYLEVMGENWKSTPMTIQLKQETIRIGDTIERFDYWSRKGNLIKRLQEYGYIVKDKKIDEFESIIKRKKLSFKEAKQRIADGKDICYDDNKYWHQIKEYMDDKGVERMLGASRTTITDWYKIRKNVGECDIDMLCPEDKFNVLGLEQFGRYRVSYLMACLKYLGEECEYYQIPVKMKEILCCYAVRWKKDPKGKETGDIYIIFMERMGCETPPKSGMCSYKKDEFNTPIKGGISHKLSYRTEMRDGNWYGQTISLRDAPMTYNSLKGIHLYDWVNEDKEHRLPEVKGGKDWGDIKKYNQSTISEMYRDTVNGYRHTKSSMEYIDCLIVDIDSGITFNDFRERFKDYGWAAYPTINNIAGNWEKFRVIVPLKNRIRVSGEYSLMVVKMLRCMFCYYEDPNHQVCSYINRDDWMKRKQNEGELYDVPQEIVDDMMISIKNSKDMAMMKFNRQNTDSNMKGFKHICRTFEWAQEYFSSSMSLEDGARHKRLFVIKNNLCKDDREQFQTWLVDHYGYHYLSHWKSHKIIS